MGQCVALVGFRDARNGAVSLWNGLPLVGKPLCRKGFTRYLHLAISRAYTVCMDNNTTPSIQTIAIKLFKETGKPMGWCMNEAIKIVREWAIKNGHTK